MMLPVMQLADTACAISPGYFRTSTAVLRSPTSLVLPLPPKKIQPTRKEGKREFIPGEDCENTRVHLLCRDVLSSSERAKAVDERTTRERTTTLFSLGVHSRRKSPKVSSVFTAT